MQLSSQAPKCNHMAAGLSHMQLWGGPLELVVVAKCLIKMAALLLYIQIANVTQF